MSGVVRRRVRIVSLVLFVVLGVLLARVSYLAVFEQGQYSLLSEGNSVEQVRVPARRGIIYDHLGVPLVRNIEEEGERGREYLLGEDAAHLVGYVSEASEDELGCVAGICYAPGEWLGRVGVELVMESTLKGRDGGRLLEKDARGEVVRELGSNEAEAGEDVYLSIDATLQRVMAESMHDKEGNVLRGSVVALDMQGKVLGLYSSPSYDPNLFTVRDDPEQKAEILSNEDERYLFDRAVGGVYPPGSVYKLVTAHAGLASGEIDQETKIEDTGEIRVDEYRYGNWYFDQYGKTEGELNVERALARSNDIFFYKVGEWLGPAKLVKMSKELGLATQTGIELSGEAEGLVPDELWKERVIGERWFLGNTYHMSIGQGDLLVTPLQVARMTLSAVSGRKCEVSVLRDSPVKCEEIAELTSKNLEIVREGMRQACSTGGTAYPLFDLEPYAICKTGTAEHAGQVNDDQVEPHAWITVAYPGENPEMILVVMAESAGEGSEVAGGVAREILDKWEKAR